MKAGARRAPTRKSQLKQLAREKEEHASRMFSDHGGSLPPVTSLINSAADYQVPAVIQQFRNSN